MLKKPFSLDASGNSNYLCLLIQYRAFRVNEQVKKKKSAQFYEEDEIDIWQSPYEENNELANVRFINIQIIRLVVLN